MKTNKQTKRPDSKEREPVTTTISETERLTIYPDGSFCRETWNRPFDKRDSLWLLQTVSDFYSDKISKGQNDEQAA